MNALCLWIAAALVIFQPPDRRPTFRSATALVEVDIIARDARDQFVADLTAADLEIFEEDQPQTIEHFYLVTRQRGSASAPAMTPAADPVRAPDRTERRVFVFFFDSDHLTSGSLLKLKNAAMDFVNGELRPDDFAGVYANGALVNGHLTNQKQELLDAIRAAEPATLSRRARARCSSSRASAATRKRRRSRAAIAAPWPTSGSDPAAATTRGCAPLKGAASSSKTSCSARRGCSSISHATPPVRRFARCPTSSAISRGSRDARRWCFCPRVS